MEKHLGAEVDVSTEAGTCAATMTPGVTYLLYARELPAHAGLTTERCMGNLPIDGAEKQLNWLKRNAVLKKLDSVPAKRARSSVTAQHVRCAVAETLLAAARLLIEPCNGRLHHGIIRQRDAF